MAVNTETCIKRNKLKISSTAGNNLSKEMSKERFCPIKVNNTVANMTDHDDKTTKHTKNAVLVQDKVKKNLYSFQSMPSQQTKHKKQKSNSIFRQDSVQNHIHHHNMASGHTLLYLKSLETQPSNTQLFSKQSSIVFAQKRPTCSGVINPSRRMNGPISTSEQIE